MTNTLGFGVVGAQFMGKAYAIALKAVPTIYPLSAAPVCEMLATSSADGAAAKARELGFARSTGDWRELVADGAIDVVCVCTPTWLHKEVALAAIAAGKHVLCEKPLAGNAADAREMAEAAERAGVKTLVGFNYAKNPATLLAREIVSSGEIGEVLHFRGAHNEDFLADPDIPIGWRERAATSSHGGALADLGSHIINAAQFICGPIAEVVGQTSIVHPQRPDPKTGALAAVENDDQTSFLAKFACGATGAIEASRVAMGRKMGLTYEITGTKGALVFDQERMAELRLYSAADRAVRRGFRTILIGPEHPEYGAFCPGAGHGFGYNDMIAIEMRDIVEAIAAGRQVWPTFRHGYETARVVDAVLNSVGERRWVRIEETGAEGTP
jgi:predicted dehydrogenase